MQNKIKEVKSRKNFLPKKEINKLFKELERLKYKKIKQVRDKHFSHVFKYNNDKWPSSKEKWSSEFYVSTNHKNSKLIKKIFIKNIVPYIKKKSQKKIKYFLYPNVYKIKKGSFFRCHYDLFAGSFGFNLFVSKNWKWDYGGILHFLDNDFNAIPYYPENNLFLLRNENKKLLHFVTEVPKFVKDSHYIILGWCSEKKGKESKIRGEYLEF